MNRTESPTRSRIVLHRLFLIVLAAVVLIIFSYGWTVTHIDFSVTQQPQRQQNVSRALGELLSPHVFDQDYTIQNTTYPFLMSCTDGYTPPPVPTSVDQPYIEISPPCGDSGATVTVRGYNFYPNSLARINWIPTDGQRRIRQVIGSQQNNFITDADGTFNVQIEVPRIRGSTGETHTIEAQGSFPSGLPRLSDTTGQVAEKMVETIFLALIATAVSILPSAILSFFAAHNLMRPVRIPLGNLLVAFILLPVGYFIGAALLGRLGAWMINLSSGNLGVTATGIIVIAGTVVSSGRLNGASPEKEKPRSTSQAILRSVVLVVVAIALLGLLSGIALLIGHLSPDGILSYVTSFIGSLGQITQLLIVPIAGIMGAFWVASIGGTLTRSALRQTSGVLNHVLGGVLGALGGAILLFMIASVGMAAAWLGLLVPVITAGLASPILPLLYRRLFNIPLIPSVSQRGLIALLGWVGAIAVFVLTFLLLNIRSAVIGGLVPPHVVVFSLAGIDIYSYVAQAMLIGGILAGITGGLQGIHFTFGIGSLLYNITRTLLNSLRSIEPLIMGLVFVIWVGIGPFAGVLALALHSVASLGKLYSEQIETIDNGPIEALQSTGANRLQIIMFAVVPQIIPSYIAFTMYRWDINVRMSTIIGFVGGGGIGFLLQQQINLLNYRDAGVAVLAIAIIVSLLDYASAAIRERYV